MDAKETIRCLLHAGWPLLEWMSPVYVLDLGAKCPDANKLAVSRFVGHVANLVHAVRQMPELHWHVNGQGLPIFLAIDRDWFRANLANEEWRVLRWYERSPSGLRKYKDGRGNVWIAHRNGLLVFEPPRPGPKKERK